MERGIRMRTCKEKTDVSKSHAGPLICGVRVNRAECGGAALDVNSEHKREGPNGPRTPPRGCSTPAKAETSDSNCRLPSHLGGAWPCTLLKERSEGPHPPPQDLLAQAGGPGGGGSLLGGAPLPGTLPCLSPSCQVLQLP